MLTFAILSSSLQSTWCPLWGIFLSSGRNIVKCAPQPPKNTLQVLSKFRIPMYHFWCAVHKNVLFENVFLSRPSFCTNHVIRYMLVEYDHQKITELEASVRAQVWETIIGICQLRNIGWCFTKELSIVICVVPASKIVFPRLKIRYRNLTWLVLINFLSKHVCYLYAGKFR